MAVETKICGIRGAEAMDAAVAHRARFVGLNFFEKSPRYVSMEEARALCGRVPETVGKVGVFVDPDDMLLEGAITAGGLSMVQLHGREEPKRAADIRTRFGVDIMKVIKVSEADDLDAVAGYEPVADWLMFDTKPPKGATLPGGNAIAFDWRLLAGRSFRRPWMLAGGLDPENVAEAVSLTGARCVDVSSGVESAPGVKDPEKIRTFLDTVRAL